MGLQVPFPDLLNPGEPFSSPFAGVKQQLVPQGAHQRTRCREGFPSAGGCGGAQSTREGSGKSLGAPM